jgi:DNA-binding MarR family transcriptional regulator
MNVETIRSFREKLQQLEKEIEWQLKSDTECCGVTLTQYHIILEIGNDRETSVVDLATTLDLDTSTLRRHINGMVNAGLVYRVFNPKNRRYVSITLTNQGRKVYRAIEDICHTKYAKLFEFIPQEKQQQTLESFLLLIDAIVATGK